MSRVQRLLRREDVLGLINRLDKKDSGDAAIALMVLGRHDSGPSWPPRPNVVHELCLALKAPEKRAAAAHALVGIGAPALDRLSQFIYDDEINLNVAYIIDQIREQGVPLPEQSVVLFREAMEHADPSPSKSAERRQHAQARGQTAEEIEDQETRHYPQLFAAAATALGGDAFRQAAWMNALLEPAHQERQAESPSHGDVVDEIMTLDTTLNGLSEHGKGPRDPEWQDCDQRLTSIGEELYAEGGEERMKAVLELAYQRGLRGRYAERHWTGIGTWMG